VLQANQFQPIAFEATIAGFGLTMSVSRLAATLLAAHGDSIDDELGVTVSKHLTIGRQMQMVFRGRGLLTVTDL